MSPPFTGSDVEVTQRAAHAEVLHRSGRAHRNACKLNFFAAEERLRKWLTLIGRPVGWPDEKRHSAAPRFADTRRCQNSGEPSMIEVHGLSKRYGDKLAVDDLSFTVQPGVVTGFLGPNGAGKSTTMRLILGLDRPDVRRGPGQRAALRLREVPDARGRRPARRQGRPRRAHRAGPPRGAVPVQRDPHEAGGRGPRDDGHARGREEADPRLLARHVPAARHRGGHARRPAGGDVRRARERPRPRGHHLDPAIHADAGGAGADRFRVQPPHERDVHHRRTSDRHRSRQAPRRHEHGGLHHREFAGAHPGPLAPAGAAGRGARGRRCAGHAASRPTSRSRG